jgi:hypothetical protein
VRQYDQSLSEDTKNELAKAFPDHLSRPQKIGYLGGEGGSGKSFCVLGLVEFLTMWGCSKRVVVAAPTNLAACLINGQTWQSAFAHSERHSKEDGDEPATIDTLRQGWAGVLLFIMDEVSMVGASDLEVIDKKLKMIFQNNDKVMGGTSVLFGGDMRQLPPVQKIALYQYSAALKASENTKLNIEGLSIWQTQMDVCHLLIGNFRAKADPGWAKDLEEFRNGPSKALLEKFNNTLDIRTSPAAPNSVVLCYRNTIRQALNRNCFLSRCTAAYNANPQASRASWQTHGGGLLEVKASVMVSAPKRKKATKKTVVADMPPAEPTGAVNEPQTLPESAAKKMAHLSALVKYIHDSSKVEEKSLGSLTPRLGLMIGEQYTIPYKLSSPSGGAPKGMEVELVDIILKPGTTAQWDTRRRHHTVRAEQVHCLIVKATLGEVSKRVLAPGMPPGVLAISPDTKTCHLDFQGITDHFKLTQLPLTSGFARTLHKVQGQKKLAVVVYPEKGTSGAFAYCGLSRCPTMANTRLLSYVNGDPMFYKRTQAEIIDSIRLELLSIATRRVALTTFGEFDGDDVVDATQEFEDKLVLAKRNAILQCDCLIHSGGDPNKKKQKPLRPAPPVPVSTLAPSLPGARMGAHNGGASTRKPQVLIFKVNLVVQTIVGGEFECFPRRTIYIGVIYFLETCILSMFM